MTSPERHVEAQMVRVFADDAGRFGNPLGVILDERRVLDPEDRLCIAQRLGRSETAFINSVAEADITVYGLTAEVNFAGHAAVGVAWYLHQVVGADMADGLATRSGQVSTWEEDGLTWVSHGLAHTPPWWHERLADPASVDQLSGPQTESQSRTMIWAWRNESAGTVRARTFASDFGVAEDEANGSGSMRLAAALGRTLEIHHGAGSVIQAEHVAPGVAALGGLVVLDGPREVTW